MRRRDDPQAAQRMAFWAELRARHPRFSEAVLADARVAARCRGERHAFGSRADGVLQALRLAWASDAFAAQVAYRAKARLQALRSRSSRASPIESPSRSRRWRSATRS